MPQLKITDLMLRKATVLHQFQQVISICPVSLNMGTGFYTGARLLSILCLATTNNYIFSHLII